MQTTILDLDLDPDMCQNVSCLVIFSILHIETCVIHTSMKLYDQDLHLVKNLTCDLHRLFCVVYFRWALYCDGCYLNIMLLSSIINLSHSTYERNNSSIILHKVYYGDISHRSHIESKNGVKGKYNFLFNHLLIPLIHAKYFSLFSLTTWRMQGIVWQKYANITAMSRISSANSAKFLLKKTIYRTFYAIAIFEHKPWISWILLQTSDIFNLVSESKQSILDISSVVSLIQVPPLMPRFGIRAGRPTLIIAFIKSDKYTLPTAMISTNYAIFQNL